MALALHTVNPGLISGIPYVRLNLLGVIYELRDRSNPWRCLVWSPKLHKITPKLPKQITNRLHVKDKVMEIT